MPQKTTENKLRHRIAELEKKLASYHRTDRILRRLMQAIEQSSEGIALVDLDGKLEYINHAFADMHGHSADELTGKHLSIFHSQEQMPAVEDANRIIQETGEFMGEIWHVKTDGTAFPTMMHNTLLTDENGEPVGMIGTIRDISDVKHVEKELRAAHQKLEHRVKDRTAELELANEKLQAEIEERSRAEKDLTIFKKFAQESKQALGMADLDGAIMYCNHSLCELLGEKSPQHAVGKNVRRYYPDEHLKELLEEVLPTVMSEGQWIGKIPLLSKKGKLTRAIQGVFLIRDDQGQPYRLANVITDITKEYEAKQALQKAHDELEQRVQERTADLVRANQNLKQEIEERKLAQRALAASEQRYRSLVENIELGVVLIDSEKNVVMANAAHGKLFGTKSGEIVGKKCHRQFRDRETPCPDCPGDFALESGKPVVAEIGNERKDGSRLLLRIHAFPISNGDAAPTQFIEVVEDITDWVKMESQLLQAQKMEAIGTLAGGIAHDFNNLLMGIQGRTSLAMMDADTTHPNYHHLEGIEEYVKKAADLTQQLLAFSRGGRYQVKPVDLNDLVKKNVEMFGRTKKEITIHQRLAGDIRTVEVDQGQIEQVILNLFVNAWQAMPGGGELFIDTSNVLLDEAFTKLHSRDPGVYVKLSIADTGQGMDSRTLEKVFEPFFTTKQMGRGTGLGLASAYGIIKNHGGIITVESQVGHGTTFDVYLPGSSKKPLAPEEPNGKTVKKGVETILLVDDEEIIVEVGQALLEEMEYRVLAAQNGPEALDLYASRSDEIDLVILDMIMPGMGGGEVFDRLKRTDPNVKVLLSSGYSVSGEATEILDRGCHGFIQKPFTISELSKKIRDILNSGTNKNS